MLVSINSIIELNRLHVDQELGALCIRRRNAESCPLRSHPRLILETVPRWRLQGYENFGPSCGRHYDVSRLSWLPRQDAGLEDVSARCELGSCVQTDFRHGATLDQLPGVIVLCDVLTTNLAIPLPDGRVLIELLLGVLLLPAPDRKRFRHQRRPRNEWHLLPWKRVLPL